MEKKPLIPIDEGPLDIWYESPSVMAVKKPKGIAVHPKNESESGTLLNRLFQHNRWLAQMETSTSAGVLHVFEQNDHGLMLFSKNDDYQEELTKALESNEMTFCYFITIKDDHKIDIPTTENYHFTIKSQKQLFGYTVIDLRATVGNTRTIRDLLFPELESSETTFYCYEIKLTLPHTGELHTFSLRDSSKDYPNIVVFHAPPCSSCREAREFLLDNGFIYQDNSVMDKEVFKKMMEINGGKKVIPTIIIGDQIEMGFDRNRLKGLLGVK
ncbi:pseudouridine synthase [Alkalihalobacillus deserti]|uniref:pseudouridine synthase n=1 Tax=Alkalihalobacillus deserti TaxID=2879466 RepID=UPI001D149820|nr:pseudouridine synthase [Alkalihalobacillus deserti]